jgi:hypothetical protein
MWTDIGRICADLAVNEVIGGLKPNSPNRYLLYGLAKILAKQQILSVCWLDESVLRVSLPALKHGLAKILSLSMPAEGIVRP